MVIKVSRKPCRDGPSVCVWWQYFMPQPFRVEQDAAIENRLNVSSAAIRMHTQDASMLGFPVGIEIIKNCQSTSRSIFISVVMSETKCSQITPKKKKKNKQSNKPHTDSYSKQKKNERFVFTRGIALHFQGNKLIVFAKLDQWDCWTD